MLLIYNDVIWYNIIYVITIFYEISKQCLQAISSYYLYKETYDSLFEKEIYRIEIFFYYYRSQISITSPKQKIMLSKKTAIFEKSLIDICNCMFLIYFNLERNPILRMTILQTRFNNNHNFSS